MVRSLNHGEGREGPKEKTPLPPPPRSSQVPHPVLASCLRRACDMRATKGRRQGRPPPPTPPPPRGCARRVGGATTGDTRQAPPPPPPAEGQVPRLVPTPCLRRACDVRATKGRRHGRPPPPHIPPPPQGWGMQVGGAKRGPPPKQSGRVGRQRRAGAGRTTRPCPERARAVQAPAGGPAGVRTQGRKGDDGSHKACPPPPPLQRDRCRASCLRRACVVPATCVQRREDDKPPPPPPHTHHRPPKGGG